MDGQAVSDWFWFFTFGVALLMLADIMNNW